jgi:hypothetical protein
MMAAVDPEIAISSLRLWIAAGSAALLVAIGVLAFATPLKGTWSSVARAGAVAVGALLGAAMAWAFVESGDLHSSGADRRALEIRSEELATRALSPGSSLACLDALAGDSVETACEKALFATPANVAAAVSYAAAKLALLADMADYVRRGGADMDGAMLPLQRALEADRFGFVAHALAVREGCTSIECNALKLLRNPNQVRANLGAETFDRYVDRYQTVWAQPPAAPVADATPAPPALALTGALAPRKMVNIDFPSASSIPPISIMNPEPGAKGPPSVAAANGTNPQAPAAAGPRRTRKQAGNPPEPAPQDPVYLPAVPGLPAPPAAQAAAPQPAAAAPVQLNPFSTPPEASAGTPARAQ